MAARREVTRGLREAAIETPELDARLLIGAVLALDLTGLTTAQTRLVTDIEAGQLAGFVARRMAGEPVARILGIKEFWGLPLALSAATLVPRPDTETLVEAALDIVRADARGAPRRALRIADLGTGSGAILLALLKELPDARGVGTDVSTEALHTAAGNAGRLGLAERASFVQCSYAQALHGPFDIIVSNPPYIPTGDIAGLDIDVREHDPVLALDGGADGLDAYRSLIPQAVTLLGGGGALLVEVGHDQSDAVARLMAAAGLALAPVRADLAGLPRVVIGRKWGPEADFSQ
ncbi:peptide chain release factor N(5)-glutamine methyltransferase [Bradyrhizobium sp. 2TAF24]|uniref:peptide chain release factor N(5)-glutamine methyltransferase n=1 Tax=Bradyrhizobium sp. 2TAF24 TaxID=3233011 RepID=UPI003F9056D1